MSSSVKVSWRVFYFIGWLVGLNLLFLFFFKNSTQAEIYTYERNGVIVISSEPPPKRLRPHRKKNKLKHSSRAQKKSKHKKRRKENRAQVSQSSQAFSQASAVDWKLPRALKEIRPEVIEATKRYQIPITMMWSIFNSCLTPKMLKSHDHKLDLSNCLADDVLLWLIQERSHVDLDQKKQNLSLLSLKVDLPHDAQSKLRQQLLGIASLLRRLINHFRGDLTLTFTAYPQASRNLSHPVFLRKNRALNAQRLLSGQLNEPSEVLSGMRSQPLSLPLKDMKSQDRDQQRLHDLIFTRKALHLYHLLSKEE